MTQIKHAALEAIQKELSGVVWSAETLDKIVAIVRDAGYPVGDVKPTPPRDSALLVDLTIAQLRHVHAMTDDVGIDHAFHSDDTYDYLRGALNLASMLLTMQYDDDIAGFTAAMDPASTDFIFESIACDGIAQAVYDAFPADWDEERDQRMVNDSRP